MHKPQPFARAMAFMAALAAINSMPLAIQQAKLAELGTYESRGKGGKSPSRHVGTKRARRAALKARNVRRNRRAHRG